MGDSPELSGGGGVSGEMEVVGVFSLLSSRPREKNEKIGLFRIRIRKEYIFVVWGPILKDPTLFTNSPFLFYFILFYFSVLCYKKKHITVFFFFSKDPKSLFGFFF
jgi:hypothetical protein